MFKKDFVIKITGKRGLTNVFRCCCGLFKKKLFLFCPFSWLPLHKIVVVFDYLKIEGIFPLHCPIFSHFWKSSFHFSNHCRLGEYCVLEYKVCTRVQSTCTFTCTWVLFFKSTFTCTQVHFYKVLQNVLEYFSKYFFHIFIFIKDSISNLEQKLP